MNNYIAKSAESAKSNSREKYIYGNKLVYLKDQLPYGFDIDYVLKTIENLVPGKFADNIDTIYVGKFKDLEGAGLPFNAKYKEGALYITNDQDNENDMIDDIVHEMAHAVEERHEDELYPDMSIESEFKAKRETLYHMLEQEGYEPPKKKFENVEYDKYFDYYLYDVVGYSVLTSLTVGLFYSPYAITSLREYFANGFENYFLRDKKYLKKISPILYNKITDLLENYDEE